MPVDATGRGFSLVSLIDPTTGSAPSSATISPPSGSSISPGVVAVPTYSATDTTGPGGSNATIVLVAAANPARKLLKIVNRGTAQADLFYVPGTKPQTVTIGQGDPCGAADTAGGQGGGVVYDVAVPNCAIYAAAPAATTLVVIEG